MRHSRLALGLLAFATCTATFALQHTTPPAYPWVQHVRGLNGTSQEMWTPAHDQTLPPLQGSYTNIHWEFVYVYSIVNPTTSTQTVFLNMPGAVQGVDVRDPQGSGIGHVNAPLPYTVANVPPMSTYGPVSIPITGINWGGQIAFGQTSHFDGPLGTNVRNTVSFPTRFAVLQSGGCLVQQSVSVSATVTLLY